MKLSITIKQLIINLALAILLAILLTMQSSAEGPEILDDETAEAGEEEYFEEEFTELKDADRMFGSNLGVGGFLYVPPASDAGILSWTNPNIGGFLFPHLHAYGLLGDSTGDPADLAVGGHDPSQTGAALQFIEAGMSLRAGMLQGFVVGVGTKNSGEDFSVALEEGFLKLVDLPMGFELRGGQFFNRFGFQNAVHAHSWFFVDQNLVNGRFLSEGEMASQGGEISWLVPLPMMQASVLSFSAGGLRSGHGHGHGEDEHGEESEFEAEGSDFTNTLYGFTWANQYDINDMHRLTGNVSGAWGDNLFGRSTQVFGAGLEYLWRENGYSPGGQSLRWRTEAMIRRIGAVSGHLPGEEEEGHHEEEGEHHEEEEDHEEEGGRRASLDEFGIYSMLIYGIGNNIETGVRGDWVSGIGDMGLDERYRVSPMFTWYLNGQRNMQARLQYNWDHSNRYGTEHSIWFQIGFNWGGPEVR